MTLQRKLLSLLFALVIFFPTLWFNSNSITLNYVSAVPIYDSSAITHSIYCENITIKIDKDKPSISFSHPKDKDDIFMLQYTKLILFNDTGDARFQGKEAVYTCNLSNAIWQSQNYISNNETHGKELKIVMHAILDIIELSKPTSRQGPGGPPGDNNQNHSGSPGNKPNVIQNALELKFQYVITEKNSFYTIDSQTITLLGETEMKIDISILPKLQLPATHMAIEQTLFQQNAKNENEDYFNIYEGEHPLMVRSSINETQNGQEIMHQYTNTQGPRHHLCYSTGSGLEKGFFSWVDKMLTKQGEKVAYSNIETSYRTDGSSLKLYASFALFSVDPAEEYMEYIIDPSIGIIPDAFKETIDKSIEYIKNHRNSISLGIVFGIFTSFAIVITVVYLGKRENDHLNLVKLEHNRYYKNRR